MATLKEIACDVAHRLNQCGVNKPKGDDSALNDYFKSLSVEDLKTLARAIRDGTVDGTDTVVRLGDGIAGGEEILRLSHDEMKRISASMMVSGAVQRVVRESAKSEAARIENERSKMTEKPQDKTDSDRKMESRRIVAWIEIEDLRRRLSESLAFAKRNGLHPPKEIVEVFCPGEDDDIANPKFDAYYTELGKLIDQHPLGLPPGAKKQRKKRKNGV